MSQSYIGIAVVGCGYVSDFYVNPIVDHADLALIGVHDRIRERAVAVGERSGAKVYQTLSELLSDDRVQIVVNLTNPDSHAEVTLAALAAGKHVYTEKPLATDMADGQQIVQEAERCGLFVSCAPANILGEAFQTVWREVRAGSIRTPRLVYAQLDDGAVHLMDFQAWRNSTGSPWPYRDEFALGCNIEHSAYHLSALTTLFGPVSRVVADHATLMPNKLPVGEEGNVGPDYVTASLKFDSGVMARLTCSIVAPADRSLTVVGDGGVLRLDNCWNFGSPVTLRIAADLGHDYLLPERKVELVRPFVYRKHYSSPHRMSFLRGVVELASAIRDKQLPRLSARQALHVLEVTLAITSTSEATTISSDFDQPEPLPWAL